MLGKQWDGARGIYLRLKGNHVYSRVTTYSLRPITVCVMETWLLNKESAINMERTLWKRSRESPHSMIYICQCDMWRWVFVNNTYSRYMALGVNLIQIGNGDLFWWELDPYMQWRCVQVWIWSISSRNNMFAQKRLLSITEQFTAENLCNGGHVTVNV